MMFCLKCGGSVTRADRYCRLCGGDLPSHSSGAENRLVTPAGKVVQGEMTLSYFIAHEITHSLTHELLGAWDYQRLPSWLKEAYADYIARGSAFQRAEARAAWRGATIASRPWCFSKSAWAACDMGISPKPCIATTG